MVAGTGIQILSRLENIEHMLFVIVISCLIIKLGKHMIQIKPIVCSAAAGKKN